MDVEQQLAKPNNNSKTSKGKNFNKNFNDDPTTKHSDLVISNIKSFKKQSYYPLHLLKTLQQQLLEHHNFNILPKINKPNIPGRPVVSSVECNTSQILKFVSTNLNHTEKHCHFISKTQQISSIKYKDEKTTKETFFSVWMSNLYTPIF